MAGQLEVEFENREISSICIMSMLRCKALDIFDIVPTKGECRDI